MKAHEITSPTTSQLFELRDRMYQYLKSQLPTWPDYVIKDWLYANLATGHTVGKDAYLQDVPDSPEARSYRYQYGDIANKTAASGKAGHAARPGDAAQKPPFEPNTDLKGTLQAKQAQKNIMGPPANTAGKYDWSFATIKTSLPGILQAEGVDANTKWNLISRQKFTMDMFDAETQERLKRRAGGAFDPVLSPKRDAERHATQAMLAQQQGGIRQEPVIMTKTANGYHLLEGWHRTIQHFAKYPNGYVGPAYVAVSRPIAVPVTAATQTKVAPRPTPDVRVVAGGAYGGPGPKLPMPGQIMPRNENAQVTEVVKMPPTKNSSQGMADWAYSDAQAKQAPQIGGLKSIPSEVYDMGDHLRVFVKDPKGPVLYLALHKFEDGYKSGAVAVEPRGRGQNLAVRVYQAASDTFGRPIYSDTTQTDASRIGIWQKLMTTSPDRVVGYDQRSKQDLPLTQTDQGPAVKGNQPIYVQRGPGDTAKPVSPDQRSRTRLLKLLPSAPAPTAPPAAAPPTVKPVLGQGGAFGGPGPKLPMPGQIMPRNEGLARPVSEITDRHKTSCISEGGRR